MKFRHDFTLSEAGASHRIYRADGVILSTATGSTGYSLSAGGPIVSPDAFLILMTALAPHSLNSRTVVLPKDVTVCVELGEDRAGGEGGAEVTFDGDVSMRLNSGDKVFIRRSELVTSLVRVHHTSFVEKKHKSNSQEGKHHENAKACQDH